MSFDPVFEHSFQSRVRSWGTGEWVGRGGRGRGPREGNDEHVYELNGQGNEQGLGANRSVKRVNGNVEGVNGGVGGAPDFSMIIAQQLQNLLPIILAQVGNQGNVENQNGNVVNENVQDNVGNMIVQECKFVLGKVVEGSIESWVRWWSGEKWGNMGSGAWQEIWL
nr:hypothetical protein [Tanacetum cinerariifolium]